MSRSNTRQTWRSLLTSGAWYTAPTNLSTQALGDGELYSMPIYLPGPTCLISAIGLEITTAAAGTTVRLGTYSENDNFPTSLGFSTSFAGTTTGFKSTTGLSWNLTGGHKWIGILCTGGDVTVRSAGSWNMQCIGATSLNTSGNQNYMNFVGAYAALPSNFPTASTVTNGGVPPKVWLKVA